MSAEPGLGGLRLTIDARKAFDTGIGTYVRALVPRVLARLPATTARILIRRGERDRHDYLEGGGVEWVEISAKPFSLREQWQLRAQLEPHGLFWATSIAHPLYSAAPMINTIHDLAQLALPPQLGGHGRIKRVITRRYFDSIRRSSRHILFISAFSAQEFERLIGPPGSPFAVTALGVDPVWFEPDATGMQPAIDGPYFVMLGNLRPHKNLALVLAALSKVAHHLPHRLVLIGPGSGDMQADLGSLAPGLAGRIICTGPMKSQAARAAMRGADALLFPSRYEGFGLPVLEAMACGCLPLVARNGISPSLIGPEALAFDPDNAEALAQAMLIVASMPEAERQRRIGVGKTRARSHSWDRTADATVRALLRAASSLRGKAAGASAA